MSYADEIEALKNHGHPMVVTMQVGAMRVAIKADAEIARLRESLAVFVHAHHSGNSVPPHIVEKARAALAPVEVGNG